MLKKITANILIFAIAFLCAYSAVYADTDKLSGNIRVVSDDTGFKLNFLVDRSEAVNAFDRINIIVLKPNCSFDSMTTESEIESSIYIIKNVLGNESADRTLFSYSFPSTVGNDKDIDIYPIKIAVTAVDGSYSEVNLQYKKISHDYRSATLKALSTTSKEDFINVWTNKAAPIFDITDSDVFDKYINLVSKQFVLVRNAFFSDNNITEFQNMPSVIDCVQKAISLYILENSDKNAAKEMIEKYGFVFSDIYDLSKDFNAFYTLYSAVKNDYDDAENLDYLKKVCIMANMQKGSADKTVDDIANCIRKYEKEMKIDLSYALQKSVSINKIAGRINTDNISIYYKDPDWFNNIVDEIYNESSQGETSSTSPSKKGGGTGGGTVSIGGAGNVTPPVRVEDGTSENQQSVFKDLEGYEWAKEPIEGLYARKVVSGDGNGNYFPSRNVTREEFVKMLCLAFDIYSPVDGYDIEFNDVTAQDWFYPYVCVAKTNGIVNGKSERIFGTGENISRQDMACMLYNLLIYKKVNIVSENNGFSDKEAISTYAERAVDTLTSIGIINGFDDNSFRPFDNADRGQAAKMIYNMSLYLN